MRKAVSRIILTLMILTSTLTLILNIQPVKADDGTIYIRADGSIDPPTAPIQRSDEIYTFTGNIYNYSVMVQRGNIIVDGNGYVLQGAGSGNGIFWSDINNVTIRNMQIKNFECGIKIRNSRNNNIYRNDITNNLYHGISIWESSYNSIYENSIINNGYQGIELNSHSDCNIIYRNNIKNNGGCGIRLDWCCNNNNIYENNIAENNGSGIDIYQFSNFNKIYGNNISGNNKYSGIGLGDNCDYNDIYENYIVENKWSGISLVLSANNSIYRNHIIKNAIVGNKCVANSSAGIALYNSADNSIYNNNFIDNCIQVLSFKSVNHWDIGYPFGGNYWSDYIDVDQYSGPNQDQPGSDRIWDHPYVINENNIDHYPLVNPWTPTTSIQTWLFDSDFQYNLDDDYGNVEGTGHLTGKVTLSAGALTVEGQITINGPLPSAIPEVYLVSTDGPSKELAKQSVDISRFSYWQTGLNTYSFTGQIPNVIQPINNGHYEVEAIITYKGAKYEFFINTASLINSHYFPLTLLAPPEDKPPTCVVKLQKDGIEINEVDVGEFFDIYVGDSTDDKGIKAVRFSSDDVQDGVPTGEWTRWYDWDVSSEDWDALTKIKRWAFATPGAKEVWAEVKDETGQSNSSSAKIFAKMAAVEVQFSEYLQSLFKTPFKGKVIGITFDGGKQEYEVGDVLRISVEIEGIGRRGPYFVYLYVLDPYGKIAYETQTENDIWIEEGKSTTDLEFHYSIPQGAIPGKYHVVAKLVVRLSGAIDIPVYYRGLDDEVAPPETYFIVKGDISTDSYKEGDGYKKLRKEIEDSLKTLFPVYYKMQSPIEEAGTKANFVLGIDPLRENPILTRYKKVTIRIHLTQELQNIIGSVYGEKPSINLFAILPSSRVGCLETYVQRELAQWVFNFKERSLEEIIQWVISKGIEMIINEYIANMLELGEKIYDITYSPYRTQIGETMTEDSLEVYLPIGVQMTIEANGISPSFLGTSALSTPAAVISMTGGWNGLITEDLDTINIYLQPDQSGWDTFDLLRDLLLTLSEDDYHHIQQIKLASPSELRVYDSQGRVTGLVNGEIRTEIPKSIFSKENMVVTIFNATDLYNCQVIGTHDEIYNLMANFIDNGIFFSFDAAEIPILTNAIHQYTINWKTLSLGEEGVTVQVDSDGDGFFEKTFASDSKLTYKEFMFPTKATFTFNALWEGVNYPVIVSSSNSTIAEFNFYQSLKQISFKVSGETGTSGYCNVTIPKNLLKGEPWTVRLNGTDWTFTATQNETHSFLYFTYTHSSTYEVTIQGTWAIPEFPSTTILLTFVLNTLTAIILLRKKRKAKSYIKL